MKATDLLDEIGEQIGEDFSHSPLWTKAELVKDLRVVVGLFGELTQLVDRCRVCLVNYNTGESIMPTDFGQVFFGQYSQQHLDLVALGETEFLSETWPKDTTGSPKGITSWGQGLNGRVRFIPVPTTVEVPVGTGTAVSSITLNDGVSDWDVECDNGVLVTSAGTGTAETYVVEGYGLYWDLTVNTSGVLVLTASSSTTSSEIVFKDASHAGRNWAVAATLSGELWTEYAQGGYGVCTGVIVEESGVDTYQDMNSDYGIVVDAYADGVATSPEHCVKVDKAFGVVQFGSQYTGEATIWYKGLPQEVENLYSEIVISDGLLPIVKHGLLARAYAKDGDGQDLQKSKLLAAVFLSECRAVRDTFGKRW